MKKELWQCRHPSYDKYLEDWTKCRMVYNGGREFVIRYLKRYSKREDTGDFETRQSMTYNPGFAGTIVDEIKNSIYLRMHEITRKGGDKAYQDAILGLNGGVDLHGASINNFIGQYVLPELLITSCVGVYVDMPPGEFPTLADLGNKKPYLYYYTAEQIYSWNSEYRDGEEFLTSLLLHETVDEEEYGLVTGTVEQLRHLTWTPEGVQVDFYDTQGKHKASVFLKGMRRIPFVIAGITKSILRDIADYQIALLNLESSDIQHILNGNFSLYVQPYDPRLVAYHNAQGDTGGNPADDRTKEIKVGPMNGIGYPIGSNAPEFINPSSEPMKASMEKQAQMKNDMRKLANLALTSIEPKFASAESKQMDDRSLESGLSYIGLELERLERVIGEIWCDYVPTATPITVKYPRKYSLKTDKDRREDAKEQVDLSTKVPSRTFNKEMGKMVARTLLEQKISDDTLTKIDQEIDSAAFQTSDPAAIKIDVEAGLVSQVTASNARGYDGEKEVPVAKEEHTKRLAEIAAAQTPQGVANGNPGAKEEKQNSQNPDNTGNGAKPVRGAADGN